MKNICVPVLTNLNSDYSIFTDQHYSLEDYQGLFICPQQHALNFRHRLSEPGYFSSWHLAGDPTLIIIRQGILRIGLRDNSHRDFSAGDLFIAQDRLPENGQFDEQVHGHTAQVIGNDQLLAVHIKLFSLDD